MDELSTKNFKAVQVAINQLESRTQGNTTELQHIKRMLAQVMNENALLKQEIAVLKAQALGSGSTVGV